MAAADARHPPELDLGHVSRGHGILITRAYIDQPCTLLTPHPLAPKAAVDQHYALSTSELQFFYDNGYLGPYPAFSSGKIEQLARSLMLRRTQPSHLYGFPTDRDLHFEDGLLLDFWRSRLF